eukprot:COSAG02_NODE_1382_length_12967_cov_9.151694_7_plen_63_part_00
MTSASETHATIQPLLTAGAAARCSGRAALLPGRSAASRHSWLFAPSLHLVRAAGAPLVLGLH